MTKNDFKTARLEALIARAKNLREKAEDAVEKAEKWQEDMIKFVQKVQIETQKKASTVL